ncbi:hypothetical protein B0T13DRAFT_521380 [Neurospora crassa]|nr:hypothetical protein B0T13DRAFT_521380 [Neurospora crassa]
MRLTTSPRDVHVSDTQNIAVLCDLKLGGAVQDVDTAPVTNNSGHAGQGPEVVEPVPVQNKIAKENPDYRVVAYDELCPRWRLEVYHSKLLWSSVAGESDEDGKNEEERLNEMVGAEAPNPMITNEELLRTPATYARSCCDGRGVLRGVLRKEGED